LFNSSIGSIALLLGAEVLGAHDTYYVGTIKGVGRIYQQTFIDTYSKIAFAKLYDRKNALVAADPLNLEEKEVPQLRVPTDRGTEYCGAREHHQYQLSWPSRISITAAPRPALGLPFLSGLQ
jgi:hypothetical protein